MRRITIALLFLTLFACNKNEEKPNVTYPYTEHDIVYMGTKAGLSSSSSNEAFDNGLNEIIQQYSANNPGSLTGIVIDNVSYDIIDLRETTAGGVPNSDWELLWADLEKYDYSVGSCWGFASLHLPSRGGNGTANFIYAIVTNAYDTEVRYVAIQGSFTPSATRSVQAEDPLHFALKGNFGNAESKARGR